MQCLPLISLLAIIFAINTFYVFFIQQKLIGHDKMIRYGKLGGKRYVTMNLNTSIGICGGLGNMMWRTASMYLIGKKLNRSVYFETIHKCYFEAKEEFEEIFENNHFIFHFMQPKSEHVQLVLFGMDCCRYDSPERLKQIRAPIIQLGGSHFQSYKYFINEEETIHHFFKFNKQIVKQVEDAGNKIFQNHSSDYKLCVHTRRDDFLELGQASKKSLTNLAIEYVAKSRKDNDNVTVVLLGNDKNFLYEIDVPQQLNTVIPMIKNRGVDLSFAINYCDAFILTAPTSTFSWWIAFLMPKKSAIYYLNCADRCNCFHVTSKDYFPLHWKPLRLNEIDEMEDDVNRC